MPQFDERLRAAAKIAGDAIMASYASDAEPDHQFSPEFEQKIEVLIRQTGHKPGHPVLQKVASVILAIALGTGVWLAVDTDARAAVLGWIRAQYENIFHYYFDGEADITAEYKYELGWLPEGYSFVRNRDAADRVNIIYANESGDIITLFYTTDLNDTSLDVFVMDDAATTKCVKIGDITADLYITSAVDSSNAIAWVDAETNRLFIISSIEDESNLIKLAENITFTKK